LFVHPVVRLRVDDRRALRRGKQARFTFSFSFRYGLPFHLAWVGTEAARESRGTGLVKDKRLFVHLVVRLRVNDRRALRGLTRLRVNDRRALRLRVSFV